MSWANASFLVLLLGLPPIGEKADGWGKKYKQSLESNYIVFNPCSPGGSFMVQKMAITSPIAVF